MKQVGKDGEVYDGVNVRMEIREGSLWPREEYMIMLDALFDKTEARSAMQFTNPVGLGRIAVTSFALGGLGAAHLVGLAWSFSYSSSGATLTRAWCAYFVALCFYHMSEFITTARYNAPIVAWESFLLNQSKAYQIALVASWVEFWLEVLVVPGLKSSALSQLIMFIGVVLVLVGQSFRTGAMVEAGSNFTHIIQTEKSSSHKLVTTGLYSIVRHPSYFGWFWWSIGTQLLMCNPICAAGYAYAAWMFFNTRIPFEEDRLIKFFPDEYPAYRRKTPIGIPFIEA
ncbi:Protein-S-isoprenylcysteine O-methyltransferase [Hondaea fermentalgiana]|uniref:Protein-S-isoprenylcysteine O-methyltransferase n=1 Tax=Hondaea fermentalgiana TaxID=2315210 RepID=A0A2R5GLA1_9STRA|nr:Protein-S-isoprenylcysteine O-methyltransferase [Hondaea fermentalgiana]|eukprot:GBG30518.1 Protein-S-isoprenylcysteine O-methyltransferase [Hondaea fermentalgiana]